MSERENNLLVSPDGAGKLTHSDFLDFVFFLAAAIPDGIASAEELVAAQQNIQPMLIDNAELQRLCFP